MVEFVKVIYVPTLWRGWKTKKGELFYLRMTGRNRLGPEGSSPVQNP